MKKQLTIFVFILSAFLICSCQLEGAYSNSGSESQRSSETVVENESVSATEVSPSSTVPSPDPIRFLFTKYDMRRLWAERAEAAGYPEFEGIDEPLPKLFWDTDQSETKMVTRDSLPYWDKDNREDKADVLDGDAFYAGLPGISFIVPEGYYVYHIKGRYKDASGKPVRLDFVDEYIFTIKEVSEERLVQDIDQYAETAQNWNDALEYKNPGYIVYSFKILPKEYLPIESLYVSALHMTNEYRIMGAFLINPGTCEWWGYPSSGITCYHDPASVDPAFQENGYPEITSDGCPIDSWEAALYQASQGSGLRYSDLDPISKISENTELFFFFDERSLFKNSTAGRLIRARGYQAFGEITLSADTSVLNDSWWESYEEALASLRNKTAEYTYPDVQITFRPTRYPDMYKEFVDYDNDMLSGWYQDETSDHELRAFIYANLAVRMDIRLEDVMILLKDTEHGRLFYAFIIDSESEAAKACETGMILTPVDRGVDYLSICGLDFARAYTEKYLK